MMTPSSPALFFYCVQAWSQSASSNLAFVLREIATDGSGIDELRISVDTASGDGNVLTLAFEVWRYAYQEWYGSY